MLTNVVIFVNIITISFTATLLFIIFDVLYFDILGISSFQRILVLIRFNKYKKTKGFYHEKKLLSLLVVTVISIIALSSTCMAYNGDSAASYARKWALSRNSQYKANDSDCANFVSQSLVAGGYSMTSSWYNKKVGLVMQISDNWGKAKSLVTYLSNQGWGVRRNIGYSKNNINVFDCSMIENGDVIVYDWENDGVIDHVAIVSTDNYPYRIPGSPSSVPTQYGDAISQHTSDRKDVQWHLYPYLKDAHKSTCYISCVDMW